MGPVPIHVERATDVSGLAHDEWGVVCKHLYGGNGPPTKVGMRRHDAGVRHKDVHPLSFMICRGRRIALILALHCVDAVEPPRYVLLCTLVPALGDVFIEAGNGLGDLGDDVPSHVRLHDGCRGPGMLCQPFLDLVLGPRHNEGTEPAGVGVAQELSDCAVGHLRCNPLHVGRGAAAGDGDDPIAHSVDLHLRVRVYDEARALVHLDRGGGDRLRLALLNFGDHVVLTDPIRVPLAALLHRSIILQTLRRLERPAEAAAVQDRGREGGAGQRDERAERERGSGPGHLRPNDAATRGRETEGERAKGSTGQRV
mmetsp:Transcript_9554/g.25949  ORF Transcript_9554/g.25949 Transcript_9554/m.25949 type:complete len:312 (+) Transcript_9554:1329-2264(+)